MVKIKVDGLHLLIARIVSPAYVSFLSLHIDRLSHYKEVLEAAQIKVEAQGAVMPYSGIGRLAPSCHTYNVYCVKIFAQVLINVKAHWRKLFLYPLVADEPAKHLARLEHPMTFGHHFFKRKVKFVSLRRDLPNVSRVIIVVDVVAIGRIYEYHVYA